MIELLLGDFLPYIVAGVAAVGAVVAAYLKGGKDRDRKRDIENAARAAKTQERIYDALEEDDDARRRGESWVDRLRRAGQ